MRDFSFLKNRFWIKNYNHEQQCTDWCGFENNPPHSHTRQNHLVVLFLPEIRFIKIINFSAKDKYVIVIN